MESSITVRVILIDTKAQSMREREFLVHLGKPVLVKKFRRILQTQSRKKAMEFALSKGEAISPGEAIGPVKLTLTKDHTIWDLMNR